MIDPSKIPTYTGNLEHLQTHAASLKKTAGNIRTTGKDVHNAFQALDPVYNGPEEKELFNSTIPVRDKADDFAKKLESVGGALQSFATEAKPLVDKMDRLRKEAEAFVAANKNDDDWKKDQKKVDQNERMVSEVGTTWVAFQGVERDAANKITALVGGTKFVVDDGSHKAGMYGFKESDVKDAKETPWGTVDKREYTGWRAAWEWTKDNVGGALKGFFVDGVWGTIKGLGSMVNVFDWDNFKKTWSGIGDVFGGVSAYLMTPYDWAMDKMFGPVDHSDTDKQKAALRNFGKSLVAWDEWGKDPARAFGTVLFNGLTIGSGSLLKLGKAGEVANAGKVSAGAKIAGALGKAGALSDPMSYLGKAAGVTKLKVGDFMEGLKASREGLNDLGKNMPTGTGAHPVEPPATPAAHTGDAPHAGDGLHYTDNKGNPRVVHGDGTIRDPQGNIVPNTKAIEEPHKSDLPNTTHEHETVPSKEKVLEGAGGPGHVADHPTGGGSGTHGSSGGSGTHGAGSGGSHTPPGNGGGHGTPPSSGGHGPSDPGSGSGAGKGAGHEGGSGTGAGHDGNAGAGKGTGHEPGSGKDAGHDSGSGAGKGAGHDSGSGTGAGHDGNAGSGKGAGHESGSGTGKGAGHEGGSGTGAGHDGNAGSGKGAGHDSGSGTGKDAGHEGGGSAKDTGTDTGHDSGSGKGAGAGHGTGSGHDAGHGGTGTGVGHGGTGSGADSGAGHGGGSGHDGGGSGHDGGGSGSGSGDHTPPGSYKPGHGEEVPNLKRHDNNFTDTHNHKGQRKSYLNEDGDLVPANPDGDASIVDHIVGREPKKSESPYTSTSEDGANAKDYGGQKISIDLPRLVDDIAKGKVKGVEVYSPKEVEAAIQQSADKIAGRPIDISVPPNTPHPEIDEMAQKIAKDLGLGKAKTKSLAQRMKDMMHTRRDSEWLIKGIVPHDYITGP
ncbi:hypothetical protein [Streptomyces luteoverticillatus]|uniref:hypothetical protein n=1 Tax=Streptomyces luteoverticillatus TaxID=66425 RepID=UPI001F0BC9EE|nr:hypothetical protein [Streptomyces luteoverticillatus]